MPVVTTYRTPTLQHVHLTEQRSSQGVHGTGAVDNGSPNQSSSYVNLERARGLSCKTLKNQHLTRLDTNRQRQEHRQ